MSDTSNDGVDHVITVTSEQVWEGSVGPANAARLTDDGTSRDIMGNVEERVGVGLDFHDETKRKYKCSCGERFRKGRTAREHLEEVSDDE